MEIAEKLRYFRSQRGLSQEQLAERAGIHVNTIRKYELGYRKPKIAQLKKIAGGLEISVIEFLDIEIENEADLIAVLKKSVRFLSGRHSPDCLGGSKDDSCHLFYCGTDHYVFLPVSPVGCGKMGR